MTLTLDAVDLHHLLAKVQIDLGDAIPVVVVEDDVLDRHLAGEYRREQDAVVVGMGPALETVTSYMSGAILKSSSRVRTPRHAVANHYQWFAHVATQCVFMFRHT